MNILFFIPAFLIFLFCLYKLVKDDYFFIRKNISTEQIFDFAFIMLWLGLFFSRIFYIMLHPILGQNIFLSFFSLKTSEFSLIGLVLGSGLGLYLVSKYKKIPGDRLFDIFTIAFSIALPVGLLIYMVTLREYLLLIDFINFLIYGIFAYFLVKYFRPKYIVFILFFFLISLINRLTIQFLNHSNFITIENILIFSLFILSVFALVKQKIIK